MLSTKLAPIARKSCLSLTYRSYATAPAPTLHPSESGLRPPHLLTLADLTIPQIQSLITSAVAFKKYYKSKAIPEAGRIEGAKFEKGDEQMSEDIKRKSLDSKTVALIFSKRSTRTRVSSETAIKALGMFLYLSLKVSFAYPPQWSLGGHPMFLGSGDIQLGVNETLYDSARVISSMVDGIFARVGHHSEVEVSKREPLATLPDYTDR